LNQSVRNTTGNIKKFEDYSDKLFLTTKNTSKNKNIVSNNFHEKAEINNSYINSNLNNVSSHLNLNKLSDIDDYTDNSHNLTELLDYRTSDSKKIFLNPSHKKTENISIPSKFKNSDKSFGKSENQKEVSSSKDLSNINFLGLNKSLNLNNTHLTILDSNVYEEPLKIKSNADEKELIMKQINIVSKKKNLFDISINNNSSSTKNSLSFKNCNDKFSTKILDKPTYENNIISSVNNFHHRNLYKIDKICQSDSEDELERRERINKYIILPYNSYKRFFDFIIAVVILYTSVIIPYKITFIECNSTYELVIENIIKFLLFWDLIMNFFTAYIDGDNKLIFDRKKIAINYLKSWFLIDLISLLPLWVPFDNPKCSHEINTFLHENHTHRNYNHDPNISKKFMIFNSIRLFRLLKMLNKKRNIKSLSKYIGENLKITGNIEKLFYFSFLFLLFNHLGACFWYYLSRLQDLSSQTWVVRFGSIDASNFELYTISFYWTLMTITTVGYGDINAKTEIERLYACFIMCFGIMMYSFAIGSMGAILESINTKGIELKQKLQILASIKKEFGLSNEIYHRVCKVIKHDQNKKLNDKVDFLQSLPNNLKIEMSGLIYDEIFHRLYFFTDQPLEFFAYVVPMLKPIKFSKRDYLYKIEDTIDEIYLVAKGTISFCLDEVYLETEIKEIKKYNNFGEIEMCLNEKLDYNIKVKSRNCELYVLKKNNFLSLSVNYKEFFDSFMRRSLVLYSRFNYNKKRIMKNLEEENVHVQENVKKRNKKLQEENKNFEYKTSEEREEDSSENSSEEFDNKSNEKSQNYFLSSNDNENDKEKDNHSEKKDSYCSSSQSNSSNSKSITISKPYSLNLKQQFKNSEKMGNFSPEKSTLMSPFINNSKKSLDVSDVDESKAKLSNSNLNTSLYTTNKHVKIRSNKIIQLKKAAQMLVNSSNHPNQNPYSSSNNMNLTAKNIINHNNHNYNKNNTFTDGFKTSKGSLGNTQIESNLNNFKQNFKNNTSSKEFGQFSPLRSKARKQTSMSYQNASDENEDGEFLLEKDNEKFVNLVEEMIDYFKKHKSVIKKRLNNHNKIENPINVLKNLKNECNITERNQIIDKLEEIVEKLSHFPIDNL